jgi:hypothetical protein
MDARDQMSAQDKFPVLRTQVVPSCATPRSANRQLSLVFGVLLMFPAGAFAQPLSARTDAVETTVINSEYVFVAKIVAVHPEEAGDGSYGRDVDIAIEETIKAELFRDEPYTGLNVFLPYRAALLQGLMDRSHRLLVAVSGNNKDENVAIELDPETLEVMTADLTLLRDPEAVLQAARAAVHRLPANVARVHTFERIVPREVVADTRWIESYRTGGHLGVFVPVDEHLEQWALAAVRSDDPMRKPAGIRALAYFKTDENIELVQPLLDDPHFFFHSTDGRTGERYYATRHAAYQTLRAWELDVQQPVYREEVESE